MFFRQGAGFGAGSSQPKKPEEQKNQGLMGSIPQSTGAFGSNPGPFGANNVLGNQKDSAAVQPGGLFSNQNFQKNQGEDRNQFGNQHFAKP